jgi:hypothetical protein
VSLTALDRRDEPPHPSRGGFSAGRTRSCYRLPHTFEVVVMDILVLVAFAVVGVIIVADFAVCERRRRRTLDDYFAHS